MPTIGQGPRGRHPTPSGDDRKRSAPSAEMSPNRPTSRRRLDTSDDSRPLTAVDRYLATVLSDPLRGQSADGVVRRWLNAALLPDQMPQGSEIQAAVQRFVVQGGESLSQPLYDYGLQQLAMYGNQIPYADGLRELLTHGIALRLEQFGTPSSEDLLQCRENVLILARLRKLPDGARFDKTIGEKKQLNLQRLTQLGETGPALTSLLTPPSLANIRKDRFSDDVQHVGKALGVYGRFGVLRAVQQAPEATGALVGVMGKSFARGTFNKVRLFAFAAGQTPPSFSPDQRWVARMGRTQPDEEKLSLKGQTRADYALTREKNYINERTILAATNSPISPVATYLDERGRRFEIVPYFDSDLRQMLERAPLLAKNEWFVHDLAAALVDGLLSLQEQSVAHLDIKPANLFFDYDELRAVLGDFGLARPAGPQGRFQGTLKFMAPEMRRNQGEALSALSDLYSTAMSLALLMEPDLLPSSGLQHRSDLELERSSFQSEAVGEASLQEQQQLDQEPNSERRAELWKLAAVKYDAKVVGALYTQWYVERFGSVDAPFSSARLHGHDGTMDRLFLALAKTSEPVARLIAAGLQAQSEHRGSLTQWRDLLAQTRGDIPPASLDAYTELMDGLQEGREAHRTSKTFEVMRQYLQQLQDRVAGQPSVESAQTET